MPRRSDATWQEVVHLIAAFEALHAAFARTADAGVRAYAAPLADGLRAGRTAVAAGRDGTWPAGLLAGLRQGGRELPHVLAVLPVDERAQAAREVNAAGGPWLSALIRGTARQTAVIARRGRIQSEDEFYCVRERVDQLEAQGTQDEELRKLYTLLGAYAHAATPPGPGRDAG
jgi:hypothetical protein